MLKIQSMRERRTFEGIVLAATVGIVASSRLAGYSGIATGARTPTRSRRDAMKQELRSQDRQDECESLATNLATEALGAVGRRQVARGNLLDIAPIVARQHHQRVVPQPTLLQGRRDALQLGIEDRHHSRIHAPVRLINERKPVLEGLRGLRRIKKFVM